MKVTVINMERVQLLLSPQEHRKVLRTTIRKLATKARGVARRSIAEEYNLKLKSTKGVAVKWNTGENSITLWGSRRRLNLMADLGANDMYPNGVTYQYRNTSGHLPHAFVYRIYGGLEQVWQRVGTKRLPLQRAENYLQLPRHMEMLTSTKTVDAINSMLSRDSKGEYEQALTYHVGKWAYVPGKKLT
jgi:hypothetical protein